jgi:hypothetical protein
MTSPASMMLRRSSTPFTRTPFDDPLSTISKRPSPSEWRMHPQVYLFD